mmetsp:Transcript_10887/g.40605  ORF Transcript_10887/g.40605 Transcript_10887/m.40605 type:complete len:200 (+) Transcript_10887:1036-1635(+)
MQSHNRTRSMPIRNNRPIKTPTNTIQSFQTHRDWMSAQTATKMFSEQMSQSHITSLWTIWKRLRIPLTTHRILHSTQVTQISSLIKAVWSDHPWDIFWQPSIINKKQQRTPCRLNRGSQSSICVTHKEQCHTTTEPIFPSARVVQPTIHHPHSQNQDQETFWRHWNRRSEVLAGQLAHFPSHTMETHTSQKNARLCILL